MRPWLALLVVGCSSPSQGDQIDAASGGGSDASEPMIDAPAQSATCESKTAQPLDATWTVMVGSAMRTAKVHVPASYDPSKRTPIVFDIHGRTQNASGEMTLTHSIAKSDAEGFIAIYPESATSPTSWNSGTCCEPATTNNLDDTGFFAKLLDEAQARLCVDTARVYMMGMSNGAYESHRLGCELADRIAAIGPVAGLLLFQGCSPTKPMPVMMVNGTADSLSQYQYVAQGVSFWKAKNGCTTMATTFTNGDASCVTYGGCTGNSDVVLCTIQDGGHQWPGGEALPFLGTKSDNLIATDALWDFFVAHPRL
ncbi:MAG TPA: PHB depolymerase family esterase [Kofleriaceae bacterium]